jgi:hypothetical protein
LNLHGQSTLTGVRAGQKSGGRGFSPAACGAGEPRL